MDPSLPVSGPPTRTAPTIPVAQFIKNLLESGLLPAEEVQALAAGVGPDQTDGKALALNLVKQQKLTLYQATMIYQGKTRGLILGRYLILEKLGQGGMGMVYKAKQKGMGRTVAIKVLPPAVGKNPAAVQRFQREVQAAAQLNHPNIVRAYDADNSGSVHFLVMEYVDGSDLSRLVKANGPFSVTQAVTSMVQAARGLAAAHAAGVVHRDIKPGNLLLDGKGTVKILDMGLARFDAPGVNSGGDATDDLTKSGSILGTTDYMAPEQAINTKKADHRADVYSLGCTLYYLLTGQAMYPGETPMEKLLAHREAEIPLVSAARPEVPEALDAVFQRMVAKKPADRQQSMEEVALELEASLADDGKHITSLKEIARKVPGPALPERGLDETMAEIASSTATSLRRQRAQPRLGKVWWLLGGGVAVASLLLVLVLVLGASRNPIARNKTTTETKPAAVAEPLFNGKDLTGWTRLGGTDQSWRAVDGKVSGTGNNADCWLLSPQQYSDFEFKLEFRLTPGTNAGLAIHAPLEGNPTQQGLEIEIVDEAAFPTPTGSVVYVAAAPRGSCRPPGEWNRMTVNARGKTIGVELNGTRFREVHLEPFAVRAGQLPGLLRTRGHIGLQCVRGSVEFRSLVVQQLDPPPPVKPATVDDAWFERVERLSGLEQVLAVSKKMIELNANFDGQIVPQYEGIKIVGLQFSTDLVSDLRPIKAFKDLRALKCNGSGGGKGLLVDLGPLRGMKLVHLECVYNQLRDLGPIKDIPLSHLQCGGNPLSDLAPLRGMKLTQLNCSQSAVRDLGPVKDMPLVWLLMNETQIADLAPLKSVQLKHLTCHSTPVSDLGPLAGLPLEALDCRAIRTTDFSPLKKCPLRNLSCDCPPADILRRLEELPSLTTLNGVSREKWYVYARTRPIPRWRVIQPFARQAKEPFDLTARGGALPLDEFNRTYVGLGDKSVDWKELAADESGLLQINPAIDNAALFAHATLNSSADRDVEMLVAQDDDIVMWLNGQKIYEQRGNRWFGGSDVVRARLRKGTNHFLIRCENNNGGWGFGVRVTSE